jgi:hypothetical protein
MSDEAPDSWRGEFDTLGMEGVHRAIKAGRWPEAKIAAAKQWMQQEDIRRWQQQAPGGTLVSRDTLRKWAKYAVTAIAVLFAAARLFRMLRHGA